MPRACILFFTKLWNSFIFLFLFVQFVYCCGLHSRGKKKNMLCQVTKYVLHGKMTGGFFLIINDILYFLAVCLTQEYAEKSCIIILGRSDLVLLLLNLQVESICEENVWVRNKEVNIPSDMMLMFICCRVLTELVSKMKDMQMDKTELGCLRAIVLFNPG